MKKVLFVDDEIQILKTINRIFMNSGYKVFCAESAESALRIMSETPIDLIVSDMKMPFMDGIELLEIVKQKYPKTVRIILSGYADEREIMDTIENNIARTYMFKPWNNDELERSIAHNLENAESTIPSELISYINNLDRLPTIKKQYQQIRETLETCKDIDMVAAEVEKDQTITAKILQIVNSAYYGIKTGSVKKAVSFIGINDMQKLIFSLEIMDFLSISGHGQKIVETMWKHAYYTSKIQRLLQENFLQKRADHYDSSVGLLHKIGIVFMIKYYAVDYIELLKNVLAGQELFLKEEEIKKYGFAHQSISGYMLKLWNAPEHIIEASLYYDSPFNENVVNKELVCTIHIAQHYAGEFIGMEPLCNFMPETFDYLRLARTTFEEQYKSLLK